MDKPTERLISVEISANVRMYQEYVVAVVEGMGTQKAAQLVDDVVPSLELTEKAKEEANEPVVEDLEGEHKPDFRVHADGRVERLTPLVGEDNVFVLMRNEPERRVFLGVYATQLSAKEALRQDAAEHDDEYGTEDYSVLESPISP